MSEEGRVAALRAAYESFNRQDLTDVLALLTDDVLWPDVVNDTTLVGKEAVRAYFERVFAVAGMRVTVGELITMGDAVLVTTYQRFSELDGKPLGSPRTVVNRFTFRGELVSRMDVTSADDIPDEVRRRYQETPG